MKICFVLEHAYPHYGGVETSFHELGKELVKKGHSVIILTSESGGAKSAQSISGVEYHYFPWKSFFGHPIPQAKDIESFIDTCDIVHTTTYTAAPTAQRIAKKYDKPCVITVHEALREKWYLVEQNPIKAALYYLFEYYVLHQHFNAYHAVSNATKNDIIASGINEKAVSVIYHGVGEEFKSHRDYSLDSRLRGNDMRFLYYGRPGQTKGIFILLEAIRLLDAELPKEYTFRFILSADPAGERKKFEAKVREYNLQERIPISPSLEKKQLIKTIHTSYCVIIPSITEGFGFTAAESSALGIPLIISDAGSLPEVAYGKVLIFRNRDIPDLAQKIKDAIQGKFSLIPEKEFSWDASASLMESLYKKLLRHP